MINQRFLLALIMILNEGSDGTEKQRFELSNLIFTTGLKLIAVHGHIKRYGEIEDRLLAEAKANPIDLKSNDPKRIASAHDLYIEAIKKNIFTQLRLHFSFSERNSLCKNYKLSIVKSTNDRPVSAFC